MFYEYRLEDADREKTAETKAEKEAQRQREDEAWKRDQEDSKDAN
jgi:hypothetical protein